MTNIRINMLGGIQIFLDDKNITELFSTKSKALLCYIALEKKREFSREAIASLFWGESNEKASRYNLRYNVWSINKLFQDKSHHLIIGGQDCMYLNDYYNLQTDVDDILSIYNRYKSDNNSVDQLPKIIYNLYTGSFLESIYIKDCYKFNDWVFYQRESIQKVYFDTLKILELHYTMNDNFLSAIDLLQLMININPLDEDLYIKIIRLYLKQNNKSSATSYYNRCVKVLREELNVSPSRDIQELYEEIRTNRPSVKTYVRKEVSNTSSYDKSTSYTIHVEALNIEGLRYGELSQVIESILGHKSHFDLYESVEIYWSILSYINPNILAVYREIDYTTICHQNPSEIAIFNALLRLLNILCNKSMIQMNIKNLDEFDLASQRFIRFIADKRSGFKGEITIIK